MLLPGMYVNLRLTVAVAPNAFLVPQSALQRDAQGAYVYTVGSDETVIEKRVQTVGASGVDWIVSNGLMPGDRIIVAGIQSAHPGAKVAATEESTTGSRPRAATEITPATGLRRMAAADDQR
jgi:membrane fusion protein (multidrug efflux system)